MRIQAESLQRLIGDIFEAEGCSVEEARRIATYLVRSNLAGHDSHGVARAPRYVSRLRAGEVVANQTPRLVVDSASMAVVDGCFGFGQTVGPFAVEQGIRKARESGLAIVALRHSGHLGRIGEWAEAAARAGLASVHFVNVAGSALVAPFGGVDRRISTAPFAVGFPRAEAEPVILDFATSAVAEGKVLIASTGGKSLPEGSLIEPNGRHTTDPSALYGPLEATETRDYRQGKGAIRAFGEHKGSGLAVMCELLAGALTGSGCCGPGERRFSNGMLSIYLSPDRFDVDNVLSDETKAYLDFLKSSRPASADAEVLLPGEPEQRTRAERLTDGIPISEEVWASLAATAQAAGLDPSSYRGQV